MAPMYERIATLLVDALYLYGIAGLVFAIAFVTTGAKRIDSQVIGSSTGFRVLNFSKVQQPSGPRYFPRWVSSGRAEGFRE